ncbi:hypothetical protein LEP1GSC196_2566 [Leptospira meyeri serovar Semaranga str. Veldrot Semarang 173]|nr:hypothetical protein LEP1GSC196_2566 [Leptospira meyeri serovar Semaranga str. Veldrot Semarang 173]
MPFHFVLDFLFSFLSTIYFFQTQSILEQPTYLNLVQILNSINFMNLSGDYLE